MAASDKVLPVEVDFDALLARIAQELLALDRRPVFIPYWEEHDGLRIMVSRPHG